MGCSLEALEPVRLGRGIALCRQPYDVRYAVYDLRQQRQRRGSERMRIKRRKTRSAPFQKVYLFFERIHRGLHIATPRYANSCYETRRFNANSPTNVMGIVI
jgi:hypothetical protein